MSPLTRSLSLALLLVSLFLSIVLTMQGWLHHESVRVQQELMVSKQTQLTQALDLLQRPPEKWDSEFQRKLGNLLGGRVILLTAMEAKKKRSGSQRRNRDP